jgi:hypothetical protein
MKKLKIVALVLACALVFSGCSMFSVNEDRIQKQTVATVNGVPITRQQVEFAVTMSGTYQYYMYYYGITEKDIEDNAEVKKWYQELVSTTLDELVANEVMLQKAPGLGIALTDEEKQEQRKTADDEFVAIKDQIRTEVEQELAPSASPEESVSPEATVSPEVTATAEASPSPTTAADKAAIDAEVEKRYQEMLGESMFTPDTYYEYLCDQKLVSKVKENINGLAQVTDEDAKKWYDDSLTVQQTSMDKTPAKFAEDMGNNLICVYVPEDTIAVKHVLIKYKDQDLAETAQQLYTDGKKEEAMKMLQGQIDALMPEMKDIEQRLKNGESIDTLIAEFGEDEGMTQSPADVIGYLVGESTANYVSEFKDAALKLTSVGQVSDPVATYYGLHVLQTIKVYTKGVLPYEGLKDAIKTALLPSEQHEKYNELIAQWKSESSITYNRGRLYNK